MTRISTRYCKGCRKWKPRKMFPEDGGTMPREHYGRIESTYCRSCDRAIYRRMIRDYYPAGNPVITGWITRKLFRRAA